MLPVLLIPIYEPQVKTVQFIRQLRQHISHPLVIVNDGSDESYQKRFNAIQRIDPSIIILSYSENRGKGYALKYGLAYIKENFPTARGVVTADGDGQHSVLDIGKMLMRVAVMPENHLLLGVRSFQRKTTPFKSYWGNRSTSLFFYLASGIKLRDTQTGLRGFSFEKILDMLEIEGQRFDYEMNVLLQSEEILLQIEELPIETIYENNNVHSHFRPLQDSYLVYRPLVSFLVSSILSSFIDIFLFVLFVLVLEKSSSTILIATIIARILSGMFNYQLNKRWVFHDRQKIHKSIWKYGLLFAGQLILSWLGVTLLTNLLSSLVIAKLMTDCLLFLGSFTLQKRMVFVTEVGDESR